MGLHNTQACPEYHRSHHHSKGTQGQQLLLVYLSPAPAELGSGDQTQFGQEPLEVLAAAVALEILKDHLDAYLCNLL